MLKVHEAQVGSKQEAGVQLIRMAVTVLERQVDSSAKGRTCGVQDYILLLLGVQDSYALIYSY